MELQVLTNFDTVEKTREPIINVSGPNIAPKMTAIIAFGHGEIGAKILLFLACLYCQKQLKLKILLKNVIILILKSILKERCT